MRKEDEGVEEHAVAKLLHPCEELARPDLFVEETERASGFARCVSSCGLHTALLGQHPHATCRLRLDERPDRRADASGDEELLVRRRHEPHERFDPVGEYRLPGVETLQLRRTRRVSDQEGRIGRRVDVEQRRRRLFKLTRGQAGLLVQATRKRVVGRRELDRVERGRRRERDEIGGVRIVREHEHLGRLQILPDRPELGDGEERACTRADRADPVEPLFADRGLQLAPEMEWVGLRAQDLRSPRAERERGLAIGRNAE